MTIDPHDEHGARLRRALHAEVDSIVPSGDGLERIRARVEKRRGHRAFLATRWLKPALAAFGAIAIAGSAAVTAPLLQTVGDSALGERPPAPQVEGVPAPGQAPPVATSQTPTQTDPSVTSSQQPSVTPSESDVPGTVVECYPQPSQDTKSQDTEPKTKTAQPSPPTAAPSPSSSPSVGHTCAPGSSPTATITPTTAPPPDCASKPEECDTASPTTEPSESPSPSPSP